MYLTFLAILSLLVGAATGLLVAAFRLALVRGDSLRNSVIAWAPVAANRGFPLLMIICVSSAAAAAWLVRRFNSFLLSKIGGHNNEGYHSRTKKSGECAA